MHRSQAISRSNEEVCGGCVVVEEVENEFDVVATEGQEVGTVAAVLVEHVG